MLEWINDLMNGDNTKATSSHRTGLNSRSPMTHANNPEDPRKRQPLTPEQRQHALRMLMRTLSSMDNSDALQRLIEKASNFNLTRGIELCVVFDASFLMLERMPPAWDWLSTCANYDLLTAYSIPNTAVSDVARCFGTEKDKRARAARKRIAQLIEKSAEIEALDHISPIEIADAMSAESITDRQIINFALAKATQNNYMCVLLATDDGGMMYDVARFSRGGARITCLTEESSVEVIREFICRWIAQSTKDDDFLHLINQSQE